jgi:hypothetical protein
MILKILKILTVISYLFITWTGSHLGGSFGFYIILGLFLNISSILLSVLFLTILSVFLYSSFKPFKKNELYVFLFGGVILFIPVLFHTYIVLTQFKNRGDNLFFLTLLPFLFLYGMTVFLISRQK